MAGSLVRETFFRPETIAASELTCIPAPLFNGIQLLLTRSSTGCLFVPIRAMQYQAIADREEIVFVDSHGGYAHQDGEGGRLIRIAWRPMVGRASLTSPVPCEIIYYFSGQRETQTRLLSAIQPAIEQLLERRRQAEGRVEKPRILPFKRPAPGEPGAN